MKRTLTLGLLSTALVAFPACKGEDKKADNKTAKADGEKTDGDKADGDKKGGDDKAKEGGDDSKRDEAKEEGGDKDSAPPTGGGGSAEGSLKYVPDAAMLLAHVNIEALASTPAFDTGLKSIKDQQPDVAKTIDALESCNLKLKEMKGMTVGADESEHALVVIEGAGVGKKDNLTCLGEKDSGNFKGEEKDGETVVVADGGNMMGHPVGDDTLVMVSKDWDETVTKLIKGEGTAAVDGKLKDAAGRVDQSKHIWFAVAIPADAKGSLAGSPAEKLEDLSGTLDMTKGLTIDLHAGVPTADDATKLKDEVKTQFDQIKGMAGMLGIPSSVTDKVKFDTKDALVTASVSITPEELKTIEDSMSKLAAQGGMGPG